MNKHRLFASLLLAAALPLTASISTVRASDHADSPTVAGDQAADLADLYFFVDPVDNTKVVFLTTVRGFIVPGESGNFGVFDKTLRYRFQIENTDDAKPDAFIDVTFSEKDSADPQTATVVLSGSAFGDIKGKSKLTGTATNASPLVKGILDPNYFPATPQKLKAGNTDTEIEFFAGLTDDPFFFDIPGFIKFRDKVLAGDNTAGAELSRGRDTFAGYNVLTIAFRMDAALLQNTKTSSPLTTKFGVNVLAQRANERVAKGEKFASSAFKTVDRQGIPGVNALIVPLPFKNAYNGATTLDDADVKSKITPEIVAVLQALGISDANLAVIASIAVAKGDILRIDTSAASAFPNGRKPADDVVATLLTVIAGAPLDDSVAANDTPFSTNFPYLGLPQLPRDTGVVDDSTRN